ncbi:MAG: 16S rRNA (uracil(1498)-N(3))-methyltransferase, partial [Oscillospiraceae bacterium]|nr:16S rRNA (uracil(1498)-N(3))-methyltransferase [Oscillospiraceae bacterium]
MARFFVDGLPKEGSEYELTGENLAHAKVLRLNPGEQIMLCDGKGSESACKVLSGGASVVLRAGAPVPCPAEPKAKVSVWIAFPKADKAEHVIQKAVELGAAELVLFPSRYCVSRPEGKALDKKLERWQKIARAAAEQSRRGVIPGVRPAGSFSEALKEAAAADLPILFYENETGYSLHDALEETAAAPATISLMTGAEGGVSEEESATAKAAGMTICTLGPRILRCETAPLAGLTAIMYALGEM